MKDGISKEQAAAEYLRVMADIQAMSARYKDKADSPEAWVADFEELESRMTHLLTAADLTTPQTEAMRVAYVDLSKDHSELDPSSESFLPGF